MKTVRLWWDEDDPTLPGWAYTVRQQEAGHWQDIDRGALSDAALNADTADELIQVFRDEYPEYATLDVVVE